MSRSHATLRVLSTAKLPTTTTIALAVLFALVSSITMVLADHATAPPAPKQPTPSSGIPATWNPQRPTRDSLFAPFPATFTLLARAGVEVGSITLASNGSATIITTPPPATAIHIASAAQVAVLDAVAAQPLTTAAATWTYWTPSAESTLGRLELVAAPTGKKGAAARQVWAVTSATEDLPASRLRVEQVPLQEDAGVGLVPVGTVEMRRKKRS